MTITARVIADSISPPGKRITTLELVYPRFIHAEFMTHRMFSRNASSSRAIPIERMIDEVENNPAVPLYWGRNQPGMQAREELDGDEIQLAREEWDLARVCAVDAAWCLARLGVHKQIANRLLEPFLHIRVVCTATEWGHFFGLRLHPAAQPEMQALAKEMRWAMDLSCPGPKDYGEYHLPYVTSADADVPADTRVKLSVARCARVSYLNHDGKPPTVDADLALYERLVGSQPMHASPSEHQAKPSALATSASGNLRGWQQYRKTLIGEYQPDAKGVA